MALINCPECGKQISVNAKKCIHCGFPIPRQTCSQCGNEYNALLDECPTCGYNPVKAAKEAERARKEQEEKVAEQKRLREEKHDAWWKKYKWYVISAGVVLLCLLLALFVYMIISNNSDETPSEQEYTAEKAGANDTIEINSDYVDDSSDYEAWRKENGYLLGQIRDKDGYSNIRAGKSTQTDILGTLLDGEEILYKKVSGSNWREVYDLDGARLGYVHSSRIVSVRSSGVPQQEVFTTPDLKWARLQGHVKSVTTTCKNEYGTVTDSLVFDKTGKLGSSTVDFISIDRFRRNKTGQITKAEYGNGGYIKYYYNKEGYVIREETWDELSDSLQSEFKLNENGWILQEYGSDSSKITHTYLTIDEHGNWTKSIDTEYYYVGGTPIQSTITRKITYWE